MEAPLYCFCLYVSPALGVSDINNVVARSIVATACNVMTFWMMQMWFLNVKILLQVEYVPLSWVQPDAMVAQIPYTFRPRPNIPNRVRQRKLNPTFVTMSESYSYILCRSQSNAKVLDLDMHLRVKQGCYISGTFNL